MKTDFKTPQSFEERLIQSLLIAHNFNVKEAIKEYEFLTN